MIVSQLPEHLKKKLLLLLEENNFVAAKRLYDLWNAQDMAHPRSAVEFVAGSDEAKATARLRSSSYGAAGPKAN